MISPIIFRLAVRYGPKIIQLIAKQMPKVSKVNPGTGFARTMARIQSHSGMKRVSTQMRSNADELIKKYPNLFNSTDKFVNKGNAMRLDQAFREYERKAKWPKPRLNRMSWK